MSQSNLLTLDNAGPIQMGFWVPNRVWATARFLVPLRDAVAAKKEAGMLAPMRPEIKNFKNWVTRHSVYRMWVTSMIEEANAVVSRLSDETREEIKDKDGDVVWIKDCDSLFEILNEIISTSPSFNKTAMVGTPMNGLLAVAMATESGVALFHDTTFNLQFKKVLDAWNTFLKSSESLDKLDINDPDKEGSWISDELGSPVSGIKWCMTAKRRGMVTIRGTRSLSENSCRERVRSKATRPSISTLAVRRRRGSTKTTWRLRQVSGSRTSTTRCSTSSGDRNSGQSCSKVDRSTRASCRRRITTAGRHPSTGVLSARGSSRERTSHSGRGRARGQAHGRAPNLNLTSVMSLPAPYSSSSTRRAVMSRSSASGWLMCRHVLLTHRTSLKRAMPPSALRAATRSATSNLAARRT